MTPSKQSLNKADDKSKISELLTKVLIAEDNVVVRQGLQNFLHKWGYEPIKAATGQEALGLLEKNHDIHLAIIDWNLPDQTGLEICRELRKRENGPYVYVIMFSVRKSNEEQIEALHSGADDYVIKPCKPSLLRAKLEVAYRILKKAAKISLPAIGSQGTK